MIFTMGKEHRRRRLPPRRTPSFASHTYHGTASPVSENNSRRRFSDTTPESTQFNSTSHTQCRSRRDAPNSTRSSERKRYYQEKCESREPPHPKRFKNSSGECVSSTSVSSSTSTFHKVPPLEQQQTPSNHSALSESLIQRVQPEEMSPVLPMSYSRVLELWNEGDAEEAAARLTKDGIFQRFEALLADGKEIRYDLMKLVISLIEKVGRSRVEVHSNKVFGMVQKSNFWDSLSKFVAELYSNKAASDDPELSSLITNLCKISSLCLDRLPDLHSSLPILQLKDAVGLLRQESKLNDSTIDSLLEELETKRQRILKQKRDKMTSKLQPPNDFRTLSVFPTRRDIFIKGKPFLRENLVGTPFPDVDHYLDVQFRLLKEDSFANLRNGIRDLMQHDREKEFLGELSRKPENVNWKKDIKLYHNVRINEIVSRRNLANGIVHNVSFDSSHPSIKGTNWVRSKRLLPGSLVCLLADDFKTIFFATVQNRKPRMLELGCVHLCFEGEEIPSPEYDVTRRSFRMVESSSAYFVAYRHILKQLQEMKAETMPFKDYIIACKQDIQQPEYLKKKDVNGNQKLLDLSSIVDRSMDVDNDEREQDLEGLKRVDPNDLSTWPDANVIGLNDSQYKAFQSAILKEFAVIQGPPGTGKTYLGLKVAHALLANRDLWKDTEDVSNPILMLAYTNHALDQFIEGLCINKDRIIRAGGRSSSEALQDCNLNVVRRRWREFHGEHNGRTSATRNRLRVVEQLLRQCESRLHRYTSIYTQSFQGILPVNRLWGYMKKVHQKGLCDDENMLKFLHVDLIPATKREDTDATVEEDDFDAREPHDSEGHFSVRRFILPEEEQEASELKFEKNVICYANETKNQVEIVRNLKRIQEGEDYALQLENRTTRSSQLWRLRERDRWCLYQLWLTRLRDDFNKYIREEQAWHLELDAEREELRNIQDLSILRSAHVVGMTTTWASMNHTLLRQLRPQIVMLKEAAEVFEGHIVSCLTEYCQHLILIGDHQQLRPNPSVYHLSKKYSLDVSLLERMIIAGVPFNRLDVQHRMRPEISQIVRHIYGDLEDHTSVREHENVRGTTKNLFFLDHSFPEEIHDNVHSKINSHEARFLVAFSYYLLQQGYDSSQITILATYTGQMFEIRDQMKREENRWFGTHPPRVATVDNFQGEENDIILLSLVRNNEEENIGFLKTDNRVCVALSRARKGIYIVGNRTILAKQSPLWKEVIDYLDENGYIGKCLPLVCANHGTGNSVSCREDFLEKVPNGGCLEPCNHRLECGHACPQACHPDNHEHIQCEKPCQRNIIGCDIPDHKCTKLCHERCDYPCPYPVEKHLKCGHLQTIACGEDENIAKCKERCEKLLPCKDQCQNRCNEPCTRKCLELIKKIDLPCGHENTMACSSTQKDCKVPCNALLDCEHPCSGKCGQCLQGRVHVKCKEMCQRILICSHPCKHRCNKNWPPCGEPCIRRCKHSKCKRLCGEICIPCKEPCEWECEHFKCTKLCSEICDRPRCNKPCNRKLTCARKGEKPHGYCRGLCGERCICVICNKNNENEDIRTILFGTEEDEGARFIRLKDCEHIFEYTAMDHHMDGDGSSNEIKPKVCPLCNTPIEKTLRYGNVVKTIHQDIDNVKGRVLGNKTQLLDKKRFVRNLIDEVMSSFSKKESQSRLQRIAGALERPSVMRYQDVLSVECQVRLIEKLLLVMSHKDALKSDEKWKKSAESFEFDDEMHNLIDRLLVPFSEVNTRILEDLQLELERMSLKRDVLVLMSKVNMVKVCLKKEDEETIEVIKTSLKDTARIAEEVIDQLKEQVSEIYTRNPQLSAITQEEKVQIVKAIGLKQGHWFKCPQGHYYAIDRCGGAMEKSRCPDCGADIGGQQHRLTEGNEFAPEMDGAQYPAWSEQANLQNYEI